MLQCLGTVCGVTAYISARAEVQTHWAATDLWQKLLETSGDKIRERRKSAAASISDMFNKLWPGVEVIESQLGSKFSKTAKAEKTEISAWTNQHSICSAYMVATLAWGMSAPKRAVKQRAKACQVFREFFDAANNVKGSLTFLVSRVGGEDFWSSAACDKDGLLDGEAVWDVDSYRNAQQEWMFARCRSEKVVSSHPAKPHVVDLIWMALNPSTSRDLQESLLPTALSLLTQIAHSVDTLAQRMASATSVMDPYHLQSKNKGSRAVKNARKLCSAAMFLFHENAPRPNNCAE